LFVHEGVASRGLDHPCVRFKGATLNNDSRLLILCILRDMPRMQKPSLASTFAVLFSICAPICPTNAQVPETHAVTVTVVTADGKPVTNLQSQNIRVRDHGVQVKSLSLDSSPRRIVLLIDASPSMGISNGKVTLLQAAVHSAGLFLSRVPRVDLISVHMFAENDQEIVPFTHDFGSIWAAIAGMSKPQVEKSKDGNLPSTNLNGALNSVLAILSEHPQFGDSIVIFSDGLFPRSGQGDILNFYEQPEYLRAILPKLGTLGIRVFFSLAGNVALTPPLHGVEVFMGAAGGESFELRDSTPPAFGANNPYNRPAPPIYRTNSLEERAVALSAAIQNVYHLELEFEKPLKKPMPLHLEVVDERGKALRSMTVLSPESVYPDAGLSH
jgi:hypothetical protein